MFFALNNLIFSFLTVLACSDFIYKAKIESSIFSLGKARILAASACPSQTEGRAREGQDPSLLTSTLLKSLVFIWTQFLFAMTTLLSLYQTG